MHSQAPKKEHLMKSGIDAGCPAIFSRAQLDQLQYMTRIGLTAAAKSE
jgi:hypothetical protein